MVVGGCGWLDWMRTCSLTKPSHLRECLLVRLRGSRDSWIPPPFLRLVRKELLPPVGAKYRISSRVLQYCNAHMLQSCLSTRAPHAGSTTQCSTAIPLRRPVSCPISPSIVSSAGGAFPVVGNVRLICQTRSELRFSYTAAIVKYVRAMSRLVGNSSSSSKGGLEISNRSAHNLEIRDGGALPRNARRRCVPEAARETDGRAAGFRMPVEAAKLGSKAAHPPACAACEGSCPGAVGGRGRLSCYLG